MSRTNPAMTTEETRYSITEGIAMNRIVSVAIMAAALLWPLSQPARAQIPAELKNSKISFAYIPPQTPKFGAMMQRLKNRELLEKLAAFLSPLQLPHPFYLITRECKQPNAFYSPSEWRIEICYEMIEFIERLAPRQGSPVDGFSRDEVVIG